MFSWFHILTFDYFSNHCEKNDVKNIPKIFIKENNTNWTIVKAILILSLHSLEKKCFNLVLRYFKYFGIFNFKFTNILIFWYYY